MQKQNKNKIKTKSNKLRSGQVRPLIMVRARNIRQGRRVGAEAQDSRARAEHGEVERGQLRVEDMIIIVIVVAIIIFIIIIVIIVLILIIFIISYFFHYCVIIGFRFIFLLLLRS